jgi:hypothetical protein
MSRIRISPPTNSAAVNSGPRKIQSTIPSSNTRFVDANMKASAAGSPAPFWKVDLAIAMAEAQDQRPPDLPGHLEAVDEAVGDGL